MWADTHAAAPRRAGMWVRRAAWAALLVTGCAGAAPRSRPAPDHSPGSLYPLGTGYAWSYDVDAGDGSSVLAIVRVVSFDGQRAVVAAGAGSAQRYLRGPEGIAKERGGYLLKAPVALGASWEAGPGVTARVASVSERVSTPAGNFEACVRVDELHTDSGQRVATTYCPEVGAALVVSEMDVRGQRLRVTARLRGFALEADESEQHP
jgi:hypothetical protein